jgi:hypothetical protein
MCKKIIFSIIMATIFFSCNIIPENKRVSETDSASFIKPVIIIDFTGWSCTNCPTAARKIEAMQKKAGKDKIIAVSMHPDCNWTEPKGDAIDLRSPSATAYWEYFGSPPDFPIGNVDFAKYNGSMLWFPYHWTAAVVKRITMDVPVAINVTLNVNEITRELEITSFVTSSASITDDYALILWLIESKIIGLQIDNGVYVRDYEHNHVLRETISGLWGYNFTFSGNDFVKTQTFVVKPEYNLQNCSVIGMVINTNTKEVITASEAEVE